MLNVKKLIKKILLKRKKKYIVILIMNTFLILLLKIKEKYFLLNYIRIKKLDLINNGILKNYMKIIFPMTVIIVMTKKILMIIKKQFLMN